MTGVPLVVDASAMVELLVGTASAEAIRARLSGHELHAPAHLGAEVLSALGRLNRGGYLSAAQVQRRLDRFSEAPISNHPLDPLLRGAWRLRNNLRLIDGLYVALALELGSIVITADAALAKASAFAELVQ